MEPKDFIDALLAVRPRLTSGEFSVALARYVGHVTHFDIKKNTGLRLERVIAAEGGLCTKCAAILLRNIGFNTKYNTKYTAQNVQPPSHVALVYLLSSIGRYPVPAAADYRGFTKAYDIAYRKSSRDHLEAMRLIRDSIDMNLESFRRAKYPGAYLPRIVDTYLGSIPKMPDAIRERMVAKRLRFRYNPSNKQFEETK